MQKGFTRDEIINLRNNKYVKTVTNTGITYTNEFRILFAQMLSDGKKAVEIFKTLNFDPKVLGKNRIYSVSNRIKKRIQSNKGFEDFRTMKSGRHKNR